jgi:hypothetical protein
VGGSGEVDAKHHQRQPIAHSVGGSRGQIAIVWKANMPQTRREDAYVTTIVAADFAVIVERCSGVKLQIEETQQARNSGV